jgi:hypothetical protein
MKATVEIADDLFEQAERLADTEHTTFDALAEEGLRLVLSAKGQAPHRWTWKPVTCGGQGLTEELRDANREVLRAGVL